MSTRKLTFQTIKANFVYEVRRILLLETAVKAKMLTLVFPTEKRLVVHLDTFSNISATAAN